MMGCKKKCQKIDPFVKMSKNLRKIRNYKILKHFQTVLHFFCSFFGHFSLWASNFLTFSNSLETFLTSVTTSRIVK